MQNKPKGTDVSIIIPIYNVEKYLNDCIKSILSQNFTGQIEVILVNDASQDNSAKICSGYVERYPDLIKYIAFEENFGVSVARNAGLDIAVGDYFMFVDPDDILPQAAVRALFNAAKLYGVDLVKGNSNILKRGIVKPAPYNVNATQIYKGGKILALLLEHRYVRGHPWGKLFLREKFRQLRFPVGVAMAQDLIYCASTFSRADSLILIDETAYTYRLREDGSTGAKYLDDRYKHWFDSVNEIAKFVATDEQRLLLTRYRIRTLNQAVKELRKLDDAQASAVLAEIVDKRELWGLSKIWCMKISALRDLKTFWRYLVLDFYCKKLKKIRV